MRLKKLKAKNTLIFVQFSMFFIYEKYYKEILVPY